MQRLQSKNLEIWYASKQRRKPLILRGARQVGKSTLVRNFCLQNKLRLVEINLEKHPQLDETFKSLNVDQIFRSLESVAEQSMVESDKLLLFLDEIQACPYAIAALRYIYEERPNIAVIAAGSLLEFVLKDHDFSMPVGRITYLNMGPMTFEEFLIAADRAYLHQELTSFTLAKPLSSECHQSLLELQQLYALVGGMPEAVEAYLISKSLYESRVVQRSISETYKDDFAKYGLRQDILRLHQVFDWSAKNVGRKVKYADVLRDEQSRSVRRLFDLLTYAKIISVVSHSDGNGLPLSAQENLKVFKLLFLDIGIMNSVMATPWRDLQRPMQLLELHHGMIAEQFVGQALLATARARGEDRLNYWLRDGKSNNAEIDYLMPVDGRVIPVEVKSGKKGVLRSLRRFVDDKKSSLAVRIDLNPPSLVDFSGAAPCRLLTLPPYAVGQLDRLFESCELT